MEWNEAECVPADSISFHPNLDNRKCRTQLNHSISFYSIPFLSHWYLTGCNIIIRHAWQRWFLQCSLFLSSVSFITWVVNIQKQNYEWQSYDKVEHSRLANELSWYFWCTSSTRLCEYNMINAPLFFSHTLFP